MTEYELISYLQLSIPCVIIIFRMIAEWYFINIEAETIKYLETISKNHQVRHLFYYLLTHPLTL